GTISAEQGQPAAAEKYLRRALAIYQVVGANSAELAACLENLAKLVQNRGRFTEAVRHMERVVGIYRDLEPGSANLARALAGLGIAHSLSGEFSLAEGFYDQ